MTDDRKLDAYLQAHLFQKQLTCSGDAGVGERLWSDYEDAPGIGGWECRACGAQTPYKSGTRDHVAKPHATPVPNYSSDPAACAQVKAKLREARIYYAIEHDQGYIDPSRDAVVVFQIDSNGVLPDDQTQFIGYSNERRVVTEKTEELAVCSFAKALIESGVKLS